MNVFQFFLKNRYRVILIFLVLLFLILHTSSCNKSAKRNKGVIETDLKNKLPYSEYIDLNQYDLSKNGLFNIPSFTVRIEAENYYHSIITCLVGDDAFNYQDWFFQDPQLDFIFEKGKPNIPNSKVKIQFAYFWKNSKKQVRIIKFDLLIFHFDSNGNPSLEYSFPKLVRFRHNKLDNLFGYINPYLRPNKRNNGNFTLDYYGSGDVDGNNIINFEDYNKMYLSMLNYRGDIDGDGFPCTIKDKDLLNKYLLDSIPYLPFHWDELQTRKEREACLKNYYEIDDTDKHPYREY